MHSIPLTQPHSNPNLPFYKHTEKRESVYLAAYEEKILYTVYRYHYLLLSQLIQLFGISPTHGGWLQRKKLKPLVREGFLYEQPLSRKSRAGSSPLVYSLATKGRNHMEALGHTIYSQPTPSEQEKSELYLLHTLELNEVLIASQVLTRHVPSITLVEWRHDLDMRYHKTRLPDLNGKRRYLVPDGWLDFETSGAFGTHRVSFVIELDRGTINNVWKFKERIRDYCDFMSEPYQRDFGSDSLTVLWVTTAGFSRVKQMCQWTKAQLETTYKEEYKVFHRFLAAPALFQGSLLPKAFFLSPVWFTLNNDTPIPLLREKT